MLTAVPVKLLKIIYITAGLYVMRLVDNFDMQHVFLRFLLLVCENSLDEIVLLFLRLQELCFEQYNWSVGNLNL